MDIDYCLFPGNCDGLKLCPDIEKILPEEKELYERLKVLKINICTQKSAWQIMLSENDFSNNFLNDMAQNLCTTYNLSQVEFSIYPDEDKDILFIKEYLLCNILDDCPDIFHYLEESKWIMSDKSIVIQTEGSFLPERFYQKKIDAIFDDVLTNKLKINKKIEFFILKNETEIIEEDFNTEDYLSALATIDNNDFKNPAKSNGAALHGTSFKGEPVKIETVREEEKKVIVEGTIHRFDVKELRTGRISFKFNIYDDTDGMIAKLFFENKEKHSSFMGNLKEGMYVRIIGDVQVDTFERNELVLSPKNIMLVEKVSRTDDADEKRVELHAHTKMSALDAVVPVSDFIKCAANWGHEAVAITDHGIVQAFPEAYISAKKHGIKPIFGMEGYLINDDDVKSQSYHIIILAASQKGLYNLYKLVSFSHLQYFYKRPRIPKELLAEYREGLILGTACEAGELYQAILNGEDDEKLVEIASFYDYLEIQPNGNNKFLIRKNIVKDENTLCEYNKKIVELGKKLDKMVVATCDVHFLNPEDEVYRRILQAGQGYSDADEQAPIFFRTTKEMLEEFKYLGEETAYEVVVENTRKISDMIPMLKPIPDELYSPKIDGAADEVNNMSYGNAEKLYGNILPEIVTARLKQELNSIIGNGFSELYLIAHKLVKKSNDDGYLVGSRGSVGSSFVATMMDITEVNPLPPHYRCPKCKYSEFFLKGEYGSGFDLPSKKCPHCESDLIGDGHDIPFAVFLGFDGDKVPDIDLNFSGEYQAQAHKYTEELFGRGNVFRAGTISTVAEKTAGGFARKYYDERGIPVRSARIDSIVPGCTGVKRTTGQHPGGIMVVPRDMDIHYFTPVQRPADDRGSDTITTHFDYHSISDRLVKLDILGHDDPTVIKMLEDMIQISAKEIPFSDEKTTSLFSSTDALGLNPKELGSTVGTLGIPEFGTRFVRQMLEDTKPKHFSELVRISGYSHGTDVWLNNAQTLIKNGTANVNETISCRDDIMLFLIQKEVDPLTAFKTMEDVRKGKGVKEEYQKAMRERHVPNWYIESCQKIKYMFPKAHAVAYVMMAYRIAYCKVHFPKQFYAAYFSIRADEFDADIVVQGKEHVKSQIKLIEQKGKDASVKEKSLLTILELAYEMQLRGFNFKKVDLYKSDPARFLIIDNELLPPLTALAGVGKNAALNIAAAREDGEFISQDELRVRAGVSKTVIEMLLNHGSLDGLPESNQTSLF